MDTKFSLMLFCTDAGYIQRAVQAGVDTIIVDWENIGKAERQSSADTQINYDTAEDLRRVCACTDARVICRLNSYSAVSAEEVEQVVEAGVDEVLLPMVRTVAEVEAVLALIRGRCGLSIMVETVAAVTAAEELGRLPLTRAYVGLNDLGIERKTPNIFTAVSDGTVERVRKAFHVPFGFAGLTLPECGRPIACRLIMGELARLNCQFSFLRRSFYADTEGRDLALEVPRIHEALRAAFNRSEAEIERDRSELTAAITAWQRYRW